MYYVFALCIHRLTSNLSKLEWNVGSLTHSIIMFWSGTFRRFATNNHSIILTVVPAYSFAGAGRRCEASCFQICSKRNKKKFHWTLSCGRPCVFLLSRMWLACRDLVSLFRQLTRPCAHKVTGLSHTGLGLPVTPLLAREQVSGSATVRLHDS